MHMFNKICIRADGTPQIGTGHIMRCLSLADALKELGVEEIHTGHCTGETALALLQKRFGPGCRALSTGQVLCFL